MATRPTDTADSLIRTGDIGRAVATLRTALRRDPSDADALSLLTTALLRSGDATGAEGSAQRLAQLRPGDYRAWHNLGHTLLHFGRVADAEHPLVRARALAPDDPHVLLACANLYSATDRWTLSQEACREGLTRAPEDTRFLTNLAIALHGAGRVEEAMPLVERACQLAPARLDHADAIAAMSTYAPGIGPQQSLVLHRRYGALLEGATAPLPHRHARTTPDHPVTVGLLSPDLRDHAVARFVLPVIMHADPRAVRFIAYSLAGREDTVSDQLRPYCYAWRHVPYLPHGEIAQRIRSDGVDVLLDLAGHTRGHRLAVMALSPAPSQATWMGYPNTTGLTRVGARISDPIADPAAPEPHNTERLVHVGPCLVAFPRPADLPPAREPDAPVSFVSFSSLLKVNNALLRSWARVLARVPGSTLTLKHHALADPGVRSHMAGQFSTLGVDPARVRLDLPSRTSAGVLPAYGAADIALDTFPYAGTTTTCEALSMGVPVVTRAGETSASRVGSSLLSAVGLPELVATSEDGFVDAAASLALDRPRLTRLRTALRDSYPRTALADAPRFGERMGTLLAGLAPTKTITPGVGPG